MKSLTQKLLKKKWFPLALRLATLVFFIFILYASYFGALKLNDYYKKVWIYGSVVNKYQSYRGNSLIWIAAKGEIKYSDPN